MIVLRWRLAVSSARRFFTSSSAWRWLTNRGIRWVPARTDQPKLVGSTTKAVIVARLTTREVSIAGRNEQLRRRAISFRYGHLRDLLPACVQRRRWPVL